MRISKSLSIVLMLTLMCGVVYAADQSDADDAKENMEGTATAMNNGAESSDGALCDAETQKTSTNTYKTNTWKIPDCAPLSTTSVNTSINDGDQFMINGNSHVEDGDSNAVLGVSWEITADNAYAAENWSSAIVSYDIAETFYFSALENYVDAALEYEDAEGSYSDAHFTMALDCDEAA